MKIILNNKEYTFLTGYQKQDQHRASFNHLVNQVFGFSFEEWYQSGYWNEKYIPYTLFDGDIAIANISVNIMNFEVFSTSKQYIQIGTVATVENYRNRGLSRFLMEKILEDWQDKCDLVYLFANKSVLEMYPKFGFNRVNEHEYFKQIDNANKGASLEKLNMETELNRNILYGYAKNSLSIGKISMKANPDLVMFYCTSVLKENVYYIKSLDVIVIATYNDHQLRLWDIFCKNEIDLDNIIQILITSQTQEIVLGFTPKNCDAFQIRKLLSEDTLFIQKNKTSLFDDDKLMFPMLSHA